LEIDPGHLRLRDWLDSNEGLADEFWRPYDEKLEDWIDRVPTSGPLVSEAGAICVLDLSVIKVWPDGSSRRYVHQYFRLLSEENKDEIAQVTTPGEIVTLRTVAPDGQSYEPVPALGRRQFVLPGVRPGAFSDVAYVIEAAHNGTGRFESPSFFFQDYTFRQSFLLSRYVILLPEGIEGDIIERNLRPAEAESGRAKVESRVVELEDGYRALSWEAREVPRLRREGFMPANDDYLATVSIVAPSAWQDVERDLRRSIDGLDTRATPELERLVAERTAGIEKPIDKAHALHRLVSELVPDAGGSTSAIATYHEKSGDRLVLLKALL